MVQLAATWKELVTELERERDVLRLKAHLGRIEVHDLLQRVEDKIFQLRIHTRDAAQVAEARLHDLADDVRDLLARIQEIV